MLKQIHGDDCAERGLCHDGLTAPCIHAGFVIRHLVEIYLARLAIFRAFHPGASAGLARHLVAKMSGVGQAGDHHITRCDLHAFDGDLLLTIKTKHVQGFKHADKLVTKTVFESGALGLYPARHKQDFFMLHVDNFYGTDLGEIKYFGFREWRGGEPLSIFPDHGRIETFFDRCPDREVGRKFITFNGNICAVTNTKFFDLVEEMLSGITRKHIRHARLHADSNQCELFLLFPVLGFCELIIAQFDSALVKRIFGMRRRQGHRHVHVGHTSGKGGIKDLLVENGIDRVHDHIHFIFFSELYNFRFLAGINEFNRKAFVLTKFLLHFLCALDVVIGQHHLFHPGARLGNRRNRFPYPTHTN